MLRARFPHPITLLTACMLLAAGLSYILPAGTYDRVVDEATGRSVVVPGSYHKVEAAPVGLFDTFVALPEGMIAAGEIIFLVFLVGGAFVVVEQTGAFARAVQSLIARLGHRETLVIYASCVVFGTGGVLYNMHEEIVALVPVLLILCHRLGYDNTTAVAMSLGAAAVGSAFSPLNPFAVGLAQKLAGLPLLSGGLYRTVVLLVALAFWMGYTARYATRRQGEKLAVSDASMDRMTRRDMVVLALVAITFAVMVYGILAMGWDFNQMSALFFLMGIVAGLIGGLGVSGTAGAFVEGFKQMAFAAMLIGFARAIFVVLEDGRIVDTIVHGMVTPLESLPAALSAAGMMIVQTFIHFPVSSNSGQAVLTLPILVPLSDLLGISRQVTVMAYQYGGALADIIVPTNGGLMAILVAARVNYNDWLRFIGKAYAVLFGIGMVALLIAMVIGLT
ncbi:MAG: YfcC family protein [Bacteroidetes bacterium]|nr:YfcC family protein [Bacteroidota bacterium]